jgi:type II secretory pathway pseudopilin PulG
MPLPSCTLLRSCRKRHAFTIVETMVAIGVIAIGVATTMGVITKMNAFATASRNSTGASAIVGNQIDLFLSLQTFNPPYPYALPPYLPPSPYKVPQFGEPLNNPASLASYDMTVGTHTIGYKDPITGAVGDQWPVYQYQDASGRTVVVHGLLTVQVTDVSASATVKAYSGLVTLRYPYENRPTDFRYSVAMTAVRASDQ